MNRLTIAVAVCLASTVGCGGGKLQPDAGSGGIDISTPAALCAASDPRLVLAPQRTLLLTSLQLINMIGALIDDKEARAIVDAGIFPVITDRDLWFPPVQGEVIKQIIDADKMAPFTAVAKHAASYVFDNFSTVTGCAPATDACAQVYLALFAEKAYRRPLDDAEQSNVTARYEAARGAGTTEDATRDVVAALLVAPGFLYRSEMGDPARASSSPPGIPLTPYELASALSLFLTNGPPDQPLLEDARTGALPTTVGNHADRLLATPAARAWLTKLIEVLLSLNHLPAPPIAPAGIPTPDAQLYADLRTEAHLFLTDVLWNANLTDLLTSRTTFLNTNLATTVYGVPLPAGATPTTFAETTLPSDQRSGILTNAGFITRRSQSDGFNLSDRGLAIDMLVVAHELSPPDGGHTLAEFDHALTQTARQATDERASRPECNSCHVYIDPFGVTLDGYDSFGRFQSTDDMGKPIDAHATLPSDLGGTYVANAVDLAAVIARSAAFKNTMAMRMLEYASSDSRVELPNATTGAAGCAVADVVSRFAAGDAKTFSALMREIVLSPSFSLRSPAPPAP